MAFKISVGKPSDWSGRIRVEKAVRNSYKMLGNDVKTLISQDRQTVCQHY